MSISDVLSEYDRIRQKNDDELALRFRHVYEQLPELKALHEKIQALQLEQIKQALTGEFDTAALHDLMETAEVMLTSAGYDADFLDPIHTCADCRDTGFLANGTRCACFKKRVLEDKLDAARLTDSGISFEAFNLLLFDDTPMDGGRSPRDFMRAVKNRCETYADSFPAARPILLLSGGIGLGKTYIAKCIMRRVIERGYTAAFYTAYRLFSLFHRDRLGENVDLDPIFRVPLLIIDDIGTEPMTRNVTVEYFFDLINERLAQELHTIIVTNLPFHDIKDRYGERIHSRLMAERQSTKLIFKGRDIRY